MFNLNFRKLLFNGIWNSGQAGTNYPQFEIPTNIIDINGATKQIGSSSILGVRDKPLAKLLLAAVDGQ